MLKTLRLTAALGAVLFALVGLAACGGDACPATPSCRSTAQSITKDTFNHWMSGRRRLERSATGDKAGRAGPAELHGLHRAPARDRGETGTKGQKAPTKPR